MATSLEAKPPFGKCSSDELRRAGNVRCRKATAMERSCNECRALRLIEGHEVNSGTQFNVFAHEFGIWVMFNLYSITSNQEAISRLFRVMNRYVGNLAPMPCKQPWPFGYGRDADHAGTSDRHRRGDHTDRHHAQRIEVKRDAGAPVSLLQTRHQR